MITVITRQQRRWFRICSTAFTLFVLWFIFSHSMDNAELSAAESGSWLEVITTLFHWIGIAPPSEHLIRKSAHFIEFCGLGCSLSLCLWAYLKDYSKNLSLPVLAGLLAALTDETIQLSSPGRAGMVQDVWLDFSGVLTGIAGLSLLRVLVLYHLEHRAPKKTVQRKPAQKRKKT